MLTVIFGAVVASFAIIVWRTIILLTPSKPQCSKPRENAVKRYFLLSLADALKKMEAGK